MHLMVYFHHKSIVYEEMLYRYLSSDGDCSFFLSGSVEEYIKSNDAALYQHLISVDNEWAQRISQRKAYKMLFELHSTGTEERVVNMQKELEQQGIHSILANSMTRLSKYHSAMPQERSFPIYVVKSIRQAIRALSY